MKHATSTVLFNLLTQIENGYGVKNATTGELMRGPQAISYVLQCASMLVEQAPDLECTLPKAVKTITVTMGVAELANPKWVPGDGDTYYWVNHCGRPYPAAVHNDNFTESAAYAYGNFFQHEHEAKDAADEFRQILAAKRPT